MAEKNMIKEYIGSSADKRVDIIMKGRPYECRSETDDLRG